jgi:hypothetical protein
MIEFVLAKGIEESCSGKIPTKETNEIHGDGMKKEETRPDRSK